MYRAATVEIAGGPRLRCTSPSELAIHAGDSCIVDNGGLLEFGHVVTLEELPGDAPSGRTAPRLVRRATLQDQAKADEDTLLSRMAMKTCVAAAEKRALKIRLIQGRYSFDRSVFTVVFSAEERTDVKDLIKDLAVELRARIDMKQVGVRDQASLVGGIGPCGRELCCCTWLTRFESINVRMAKAQGLSLNPSAIGGCCGRLKCCLSYEFALYQELGRHMPAQGARVQCPHGKGCVLERNILAQRVRVQLDDERMLDYDAADVREIWTKKDNRRRTADEDSGAEWSESGSAGDARTPDLRDKAPGRDHGDA